MIALRQGFRKSLKLVPELSVKNLSFLPDKYSSRLHHPNVESKKIIPSLNFCTVSCNKLEESQPDNDKLEKNVIGKVESRKKLIAFTCKKCQTRNTKTMSALAYEKGVVIIRCDGCKNNHLIADNLGWFGPDPNKRNIEKLMKLNGENVKTINDYTEGIFQILNKNKKNSET